MIPTWSKRLLILLLSAGVLLIIFTFRKSALTPEPPPPSLPASPSRPVSSTNLLPQTLERLQYAPEDAASTLAALRSHLLSLPADEALDLIRSFLNSGEDLSTGIAFGITGNGSLDGWPTFRVFLIDLLPVINPAAAAEISRGILSTPTTADEWAVALRNVCRGESPPDTRFLVAKTEELIRSPSWQAEPSTGYLNAFDVLVRTEATSSTPLLSELLQKKARKDLSHAAFLTLDRLVQAKPVEMLIALSSDDTLRKARPEMTSQQFARADLRDPAQRDIVKQWLLDPSRTVIELDSFSGVYPNHNMFVSNNLLTSSQPHAGEALGSHDLEVSVIVQSWLSDPEFQSIRSHLQIIANRLESFSSGSPPNK